MKANPYENLVLDDDEKLIDDNFESIEHYSSEILQEKMAILKHAAVNTLKDTRISIRINQLDLQKLKKRALEEGLKYQSLITSILHKYTEGRLKDIQANA